MRFWIVAFAFLLTSCTPEASKQPQDRVGELVGIFAANGQFQGAVRSEISGELRANLAFGYADIAQGRANTPATQFHIASITKAFTAVLTLQQVQAGRLELDATIAPWFPGLKPGISEQVTVRHLLSHTSGIPRDYTEALHGDGPFTAADLVDALNTGELLFQPGTLWEYSNTRPRAECRHRVCKH